MSARLASHLAVAALVRRVNDAGGMAVIRARGEPRTGAILVLLDEGGRMRALERVLGFDDRDALIAAGPDHGDSGRIEDYWQRRRARDPDLWVVELMIPGGERFVAETILG